MSDSYMSIHRKLVIAQAARHKVPAVYNFGGVAADDGGLIDYGTNTGDLFRRAAGYVDRTKAIPTASFGSVFNTDNGTIDKRGFVDLKYEHDFADRLSLKV